MSLRAAGIQPSILFCGDTFLLSRDGADPFMHISEAFRGRTVCLNLETALKGGRRADKNVRLSVDEERLDVIPESVRVVSLVNNHTSDSGSPASLARALARRSKVAIGPANPAVARVVLAGMEVDFFSTYFNLPRLRLSYNGSRADALERMLRGSAAARKIVNLHWGYEHTHVPAPFQREVGRRLVDAGADIIIGHHPHVPQGWEVYKGRHICYSLGNFNFWQFDCDTEESNRWGYMVAYDLVSGDVAPIPYRINDNYQPYRLSSDDQGHLVSRLRQLNDAITTVKDSEWFRVQYAAWYARERKVWRRRCRERISPALWIKRIVWFCLPMQLKYYFHTARVRTHAIS